MKKLIALCTLLAVPTLANAATFSGCESTLTQYTYDLCDEGEGQVPCNEKKIDLGKVSVNLTVNSNESATANLVFTHPLGDITNANLSCALTDENGDVNDMQCVSEKKLSPELGKLSFSFNSYEAPYYAVIFTEDGNTPIGDFSTDDCK